MDPFLNSSIQPIDGTLICTTTSSQSSPGSNGNVGLFHTLLISRTGVLADACHTSETFGGESLTSLREIQSTYSKPHWLGGRKSEGRWQRKKFYQRKKKNSARLERRENTSNNSSNWQKSVLFPFVSFLKLIFQQTIRPQQNNWATLPWDWYGLPLQW